MQVWQYFLILIGLLFLLFGLFELFALVLRALPYILIPNWIFIGTVNIMASFAKSSTIAFIQFSFGVLMIWLAIANVFIILRRHVEDREILLENQSTPVSARKTRTSLPKAEVKS